MIIGVIIVLVALTFFFKPQKKREIEVGYLLYHKEIKSEKSLEITEKVRFATAVECIKHYNNLVFQFSKHTTEYELDSWTYNKFHIANTVVELFRFGKYIQLRKVIVK